MDPDYDMPADIDEFRNELARRIDAFVASRTDEGDAERAALQRLDARLDSDFITLAHRHQEPPPHANGGGRGPPG